MAEAEQEICRALSNFKKLLQRTLLHAAHVLPDGKWARGVHVRDECVSGNQETLPTGLLLVAQQICAQYQPTAFPTRCEAGNAAIHANHVLLGAQ